MNERIEQIAEQCWTHTKVPLFGAKSPHWEFDRHKFAELIVKDCALIAGLMEYEGRKNIGAAILDNFGVEDESSDKN